MFTTWTHSCRKSINIMREKESIPSLWREGSIYCRWRRLMDLTLEMVANTFCYRVRTVGFVIGFSTFLLGCVDYSRIRPEGITRLSDVVVNRCVSRCVSSTSSHTLRI